MPTMFQSELEMPRTTSPLKEWHGGFLKSLGQSHADLWTFIDSLKRKHSFIHLVIAQYNAGMNPPSPHPAIKKNKKQKKQNIKEISQIMTIVIAYSFCWQFHTAQPDNEIWKIIVSWNNNICLFCPSICIITLVFMTLSHFNKILFYFCFLTAIDVFQKLLVCLLRIDKKIVYSQLMH